MNDRPQFNSADDEREIEGLMRKIKMVKNRIGKIGNIVKQDGQKTRNVTKDKAFFCNVYSIVDGKATFEKKTIKTKELEHTICKAYSELDRSKPWANDRPEENRDIQIDILVKWWKHSCTSRSGGVSESDKKPMKKVLISLSTKKDASCEKIERPDIPTETPAPEAAEEEEEPKGSRRGWMGDKMGIDPHAPKKQARKKKEKPIEVLEDPGLEPPEEAGEEAWTIWKKRKAVWAAKQVEEAANRRGLKPKKMDGPTLPIWTNK